MADDPQSHLRHAAPFAVAPLLHSPILILDYSTRPIYAMSARASCVAGCRIK
jgi:hypothetical protein